MTSLSLTHHTHTPLPQEVSKTSWGGMGGVCARGGDGCRTTRQRIIRKNDEIDPAKHGHRHRVDFFFAF